MNWNQERYIRAFNFAAHAHREQKVPGTDISYIHHLTLVSMEIIAALSFENVNNENLAVECSILHDVIEDTEINYDDLKNEFGPEVAHGVQALSKNSMLSKPEQMADSINRIKEQPHEIWMIKLADRITNLRKPPGFWSNEKIKFYREDAILIYKDLTICSNYLSERLKIKIEDYLQYFS